jgi:anti-anti-sigma factor
VGTPFYVWKLNVMMLATEVFQFEPDITGVSCAGRFTLGTRLSETEAQILSLIHQGARKLVLDLTHVEFVDSAGLGIIMRIFGEMGQRGGHFRIAGPHQQVRRLFEITHTAAILPVDSDLVTSVKKLQVASTANLD